jgi:hypothetical protein
VQCTDPSGGSSGSVQGRTASIGLDPGEINECEFTNVPVDIAPTVLVDPSPVEVQVTDAVAPITVSVTDPDSASADLTLEALGLRADLALGVLESTADGQGPRVRRRFPAWRLRPPASTRSRSRRPAPLHHTTSQVLFAGCAGRVCGRVLGPGGRFSGPICTRAVYG